MLACSKTNISEPVIHALQFFPWPFHPPLPVQNVVFWKVTCIIAYMCQNVDENKTEIKSFPLFMDCLH